MQSRIVLPSANDMDERQNAIFQSVLATRGNADGPFLAWLHSPGLAEPAQQLGAFCRYDTQLGTIESELLILCVAAHFQCLGEQQIHEPIAIEAGLSKDEVAQIRDKRIVSFKSSRMAILQKFAYQLLDEKRVDDETFEAMQDALGTQSLVEVVGIIGYYSFVAMTLNAFDMRLASTESVTTT
ncbi:4-carboxymuconolactone decarboxylase [Halomonas ventosae]|uniref:4-carboxymuconolactone decarboxylase n=1 Tax=Halomonas ventosae TaxID=229007 RepID=A0A4R6ZTA4_9GAMM|nr:carboxymuconolactone decarboxylase family protein [Halomonas ventosae]TDR55997.1 4-carboxymuconolactone decarboxylase [Halomonas ventosae]